MKIDTQEQLRALYAAPKERAVRKELAHIDHHVRRFIALSPFLVIASGDGHGVDASPRGGAPGFVRVLDDHTLLVPDAPGNNRLDTLQNILAAPQVGLLFFVPGVDETLRINGRAELRADAAWLDLLSTEARRPKLAIRVAVESVYMHCAKASMRAGLWQQSSRVDRTALPTMGEIIKDHARLPEPAETQADMLRRYQVDL